jgi:hypothetical protein
MQMRFGAANSFCVSELPAYSSVVAEAVLERRQVLEVGTRDDRLECHFVDGAAVELPSILARFVRPQDELRFVGPGNEVLIERPAGRGKQQILHATVGYVGQPKPAASGELLVRAELPACLEKPKALYIGGAAIRRYFYLLDLDAPRSLYELLRAPETASLPQLRLAWRMRTLELRVQAADSRELSAVERAFNVLGHPDLRACYDAMRRDDEAPPLFPYGGFGSILVEGRLANDEGAFFADRILAYKPQMTTRRVSLLLRRCEFFPDRVICRDPRRKLEVWLDASSLPGLEWDVTWNHWKHWLQSRIAVEATFVHAGKYRFVEGEWVLHNWHAALPSRLSARLPEEFSTDIQQARTIHALLGKHAELIRHIRTQCEKTPVEARQVQAWFDEVQASQHLKPQHVNWRPDYEPHYFEQLRKRSRTWFLFRDEYLFVWANVLIAEIPALGHATYVFASPVNMTAFLERYAALDRDQIRRNADNEASALGFVGRVVRGKRKARWIKDVLKFAGEKADYVESL